MITSTRILCETVNDFAIRVCENNRDDEQITIKCELLRYEESNSIYLEEQIGPIFRINFTKKNIMNKISQLVISQLIFKDKKRKDNF